PDEHHRDLVALDRRRLHTRGEYFQGPLRLFWSYSDRMRLALSPLIALTLLVSACGGSSGHTLASHGVRVVAPADWSSIRPAQGTVTDTRKLLVSGTAGVRAQHTRCYTIGSRVPSS